MIQTFLLEFMVWMTYEHFLIVIHATRAYKSFTFKTLKMFHYLSVFVGISLDEEDCSELLIARSYKRKISWTWPINLDIPRGIVFLTTWQGRRRLKLLMGVFENLGIKSKAILCHLHLGRKLEIYHLGKDWYYIMALSLLLSFLTLMGYVKRRR